MIHFFHLDVGIRSMQKQATAALDMTKAAMKKGDTAECMKHMEEAHKAMGMYLSLQRLRAWTAARFSQSLLRAISSGDVAVRFLPTREVWARKDLMSANNPIIGPEPRPQLGPLCARSRHRAHVASIHAKPSQRKPALSCFSLGRTQYKD